MAIKKTQREFFSEIKEILMKGGHDELVDFVNGRLEMLDKKASSSKKVNVENDKLIEIVKNELAKVSKAVTVNDLIEQSEVIKNYVLENGNHISNQKLTSLLYKLVDTKEVVQVKDKKKSYFSMNI